jgi:hypothetical protein
MKYRRHGVRIAALLALFLLAAFPAGSAGYRTQAAAAVPAQTFRATRPYPHLETFKVFLSPSAQPWNPYCDGSGSEEYHMRQIASAMPKYLKTYGIQAVVGAAHTGARSHQKAEMIQRAAQAKADHCNLYLAIHSNAKGNTPKTNGTIAFYPSKSVPSLRFAKILQKYFMYPNKDDIELATKDALWEMYMPSMPHCLIEIAYHDNPQDVTWIESNTEAIAENLASCIAVYDFVPVSVVMDRSEMDLRVGKTQDLTASVSLINHEVKNNLTSWTSSNPRAAQVKNGTVYGVSRGTSVITAKSSNGLTASCTVTVA